MKNSLVATKPAGNIARAGIACLLTLVLAACGSNPDRDRPENPFKKKPGPGDAKAPQSDAELKLEADQLYRRAHDSVESSDWTVARDRFNKLAARYPFSDYATQAEMEKIYVGYKGGQPDEALADADRFLRAHPRTAQAEYVQYLKGLINFDRDTGLLDAIGLSTSPRKDVSSARRSYDDFALLVQRYPNSKYCGDARRRMIYLRNRVADHDITVAQYYVRRGAYIAAARRAQNIIAEYPGAPATEDALALLEKSYRLAGLKEQADDAARIIALNADNKPTATPAPPVGRQSSSAPGPAVAATVVAAQSAAASTATPTAAEKPGLMTRFTHLFDVFDTSKPEHQYTVVLPTAGSSGSSVPAVPATATTSAAPATAAPAASAATAPATDARVPIAKGHGLELSVGPPDAETTPAPADATAAPASNTP